MFRQCEFVASTVVDKISMKQKNNKEKKDKQQSKGQVASGKEQMV